MTQLREWLNLATRMPLTEAQAPQNLDALMWRFNDWLIGDAMNNVNDAGENYSLKPYLDCLATLSKIVPSKRLRALSGTIYRGVQTDAELDAQVPGPVKTAQKRFQSWSPVPQVAKFFATHYKGANGYVFHADVAANRRILALSVLDVAEWYKSLPNKDSDISYTLDMFCNQDEIIIRGTTVEVAKIEQLDHGTRR